MLYVIEDLQKSLSYHQRQLKENIDKIQKNQENNQTLEACNIKHAEAIKQFELALEQLKED